MSKVYLGLDVGSVSVDAALVDENGEIAWSLYRRHKGSPLLVAAEVIEEALSRLDGVELSGMATTGSGGKLVAEHCGATFVNEIVAATRACARLYPDARTLIDHGEPIGSPAARMAGTAARLGCVLGAMDLPLPGPACRGLPALPWGTAW